MMTTLSPIKKYITSPLIVIFLVSSLSSLSADEVPDKKIDPIVDEKNPEDPTKIVSRLGAGYNGDVTVNGSFGLDKARMISGYSNSDATDGGSEAHGCSKKGLLILTLKRPNTIVVETVSVTI